MSLYNHVFAGVYDPLLARGERAGMRERRRELLADVSGRVVEIGAGSGLNVPLYPPGIDDVVFTEPEPAMRRRLVARVTDRGDRCTVLDASAERLPFGDGTVDTVVSTLVLCTVADLPATLAEVDRVLAPHGRVVLVEHVRGSSPTLQRWQDRLHGPWHALAEGCHCNRDTVDALRAAGFDTTALHSAQWDHMPAFVAPLVYGSVARSVAS